MMLANWFAKLSKVCLFLLCFTIVGSPHEAIAKQTTIQIQFDESFSQNAFDSNSIMFFLPIGGKFYNKYLPSYGNYNAKEKIISISFDMKTSGFVQFRLRGKLYYFYAEPEDNMLANVKTRLNGLSVDFTGKYCDANNLYNQMLPMEYRAELTDKIEDKLKDVHPRKDLFNDTTEPDFLIKRENDSTVFSYMDKEWNKIITPFNKLYKDGRLSKMNLDDFTTAIYADFYARPLLNMTLNLIDIDGPIPDNINQVLAYIFNGEICTNSFLVRCKNGSAFLMCYTKFMRLNDNPNSKLAEFEIFKLYQGKGALTKVQQEYSLADAFLAERKLTTNTLDEKAVEMYRKLYVNSPFIPMITSSEQELFSLVNIVKTPKNIGLEVKADDLATVVNFDRNKMTIDTAVSIRSLKDFLQRNSTSSVKFIDFWATWCIPCIEEFSYKEQTEKLLTKHRMKAVYISIDKRELKDRWLEIIQKKKLYGIHVLASKNLNKELVEYYKIKSIPRYMIADGLGNIINDNAPRPRNIEDLGIALDKLKNP